MSTVGGIVFVTNRQILILHPLNLLAARSVAVASGSVPHGFRAGGSAAKEGVVGWRRRRQRPVQTCGQYLTYLFGNMG